MPTPTETKRPRRLCGVFVLTIRRGQYKGPRLRIEQYFPSTLAASRHLGYRSDVVAKSMSTCLDDGTAYVDGVRFKSARQIYLDWCALGWTSRAPMLVKQFPFLRERCKVNCKPHPTTGQMKAILRPPPRSTTPKSMEPVALDWQI